VTADWRRDLVWLVLGLAVVMGWDAAGADLVVVRWFGSAEGFALRDAWWTRGLLHEGGRWLAWAALLGLVVGIWRPLPAFAGLPQRERIGWVVLTLAAVLLVPALKRVSLTSCPWDLAEFGGAAQYVSHWRWGIGDGGSGHCFPSGHAAGAFAFLSGYFVLRLHTARWARRWLVGVLVVGVLFGTAQLVRGAHYPSHTLWTAWCCWAICLCGHGFWQGVGRVLPR
jgi:membrane-associated PAP2 superfamily phosphatase